MATLNVQDDYGAVGDGSTDDTAAIQSAIDDAGNGDTVYIPTGEYRVQSGGRAAVSLDNAADNLTVAGDGSGTVLRLDRTGGLPGAMGTGSIGSTSWTTITIRNIVFDGNRSNNGESFAFTWGGDGTTTGKDILMEDCVFENAVRSGLSFHGDGLSRVTLRRCTGRNNGNHGFNPIGTGEGSPSDPEIVMLDCKAVNNDGVGTDFHGGNHICDGYYGSGNENGTKCGARHGLINHLTFRNANLTDSNHFGFYVSISDDSLSYSMEFDTVQVVNAGTHGIRMEDDSSWQITGPVRVDGCGGGSNSYNILIADHASVDASNATIATQNAQSGPGLKGWCDDTSTIGTFRHANNPGGAYDDGKDTLTINSMVNDTTAALDVPGSSDVGAFTSDGSTDDGSTDDGSTNSSPLFDEWTPQWASSESDWAVATTDGGVDDTVLELVPGSTGRHALSWDAAGTATDIDVLGLIRVPSDEDSSSSWCRLIGRGAGSAGNETGYFVAFYDTPNFKLTKYVGGSATELDATGVDAAVGTWFYVRFNISGDTVQARYWEYGTDEPDTWQLQTTDTDITDAGWVGTGGWAADSQQWDTFSVGTGGESAPYLSDNVPAVSWANPSDGSTLSGSVTLQIDASDPEDHDDELTVDSRVDDNSWVSATYNSSSGYYEANWDSTAVADGDHSLEARATDSSGNATSATIGITTDNGGGAPTVDSLSLSEVETSNSDAEFDATWQVSDADGDLDSVELALTQDSTGDTEDTATVDASGDTASATTRLVASGDDGSGESYTVEATVSDAAGNTTTGTASASETESGSSDTNSTPVIERFSVSEAGRPDPHAEVTAVWNVSDADGDLATVELEIADGSGTIQGATWTVNGGSASDVDSFRIRDGDGDTFDVTITVTDAAGATTSDIKSVTA